MVPETVVSIRPRTVFMVALCVLAVVIFVQVVLVSERVLVWMVVSVLLALALNPVVTATARRRSPVGPAAVARAGARHYLDGR